MSTAMASATSIRLDCDEQHPRVHVPHHREFVTAARELGGEFDGATKTWSFAARHAEEITQLCRSIYGTDGTPGQLLNISVHLDAYRKHHDDYRELHVAGHQVLRRPSRNSPVRYGSGVRVATGGTHRRPRSEAARGTTLHVADVPAARGHLTNDGITVLDTAPDAAALSAGRAKLVVPVTEIETLLAEAGHPGDQEGTGP
ncbi:hypothetical protein EIL87_12790 [Saccharopolyspora rhizosphaerae]|uniref:Uncharacterized protein n=1 Tax=Saccharopolyspora rhizosphaerae TaxID=2492662 RepID=A0A3R8QP43_9PSEU|nr:hypothetical protein [Saccharopolyspora rhizosphaerae]RRO16691.1 hypothetical protein EIL87_12790 [Saccharopolyspora rhizosphaerae]